MHEIVQSTHLYTLKMANLEYSLLPHTCISLTNPLEELDIIKIVGCGTYGKVFRAEVKATKELVALKSIKIEVGDDINGVQKEVAILSKCRHENIVGYYGSCFKNGKLVIAVEYCGGGSLPEIYQKHGPLPEDAIAFTSRETLNGLEYLHRSNVMHRDIKGANLLLTLDGDVKISDFAISAALTTTLKSKSIIGTPYWMAPEVAAVEKKGGYNFQCDIWAVGITAIELAETQPPLFDLHPLKALLMMTKKSFKPENLKDTKRWSKEFQQFIKHLLVKDPKKRPTATQALCHSFLHRSTARKESIKPLLKYHTLPKSKQIIVPTFDSDEEEEVKTMAVAAPKKEEEFSLLELLHNLTDPIEPQHVPVSDSLVLRDQQSWLEENPLPVIPPRITQKGINAGVIPVAKFSAQKEPTYEHFPHNLVIYGVRPHCNNNKTDTPSTIESTAKRPTQVLPTSSKDQAIYGHFKKRIGDNLSRDIDNNSSMQPPPIPPRPPSTKKPPDRTRLGGKDSQACFSKIFHRCPLHINSATSWVNPDSKDKYILVGSTEGLYSLILTNRFDEEMEQMYPKNMWWLSIFQNVMLSISSSHRYMTMTLLLNMYDRSLQDTQQYQHTTKVKGSKGTLRSAVIHNPYNREYYYCGITTTSVIILQWFEPREIFMLNVLIDFTFPYEVNVCEGLVYSNVEKMPLPVLITGVRDSGNSNVTFDVFDPNANEDYFTSISELPLMNIAGVSQLAPDTAIVVHDNVVKFVNIQGKLKPNFAGKYKSKLLFDFQIDEFVRLRETILIFHRHGMQAKSLVDEEITAEVFEEKKIFKLLGSDRNIIIESRSEIDDGLANLYILASK